MTEQTRSLKAVWEAADRPHIQATKGRGRHSVAEYRFSGLHNERNMSDRELQDLESDKASQDSYSSETFDAIPEEFRPSRKGKDLLEIRTFQQNDASKGKIEEKKRSEEAVQNERFPNPKTAQRIRNPVNSTVVNSERHRNSEKEAPKVEKPEQVPQNISVISDQTGKQKKLSEMFFYGCSSQKGKNENWPEEENGRTQSSEKFKFKNRQNENTDSRCYDAIKSRPKATNTFQKSPFFAQSHGENSRPKCDENAPPKLQDKNTSNQNKAFFSGNGIKKVEREITVEKRIKWKSDLCKNSEKEAKPDVFYKYTSKTTTESVRCIPALSDDEDNEVAKKSYKGFKNERIFCNNSREADFEYRKHDPKSRPEWRKRFNSTNMAQRRETNHFASVRPATKYREMHNGFQNANRPIIVRHEIKVIHVNGQRKSNRRFDDIHSPKKESNDSPRRQTASSDGYVYRGANSKVVNIDIKKRCGGAMGTRQQNVMTEAVQETGELSQQAPSSTKIEDVRCAAPNNKSKENAVLLAKYGTELSDMIAGSFVAISTFLDNYEQWKDLRRVTMLLFEELEKNLSQSSIKNNRIIEIVEMVGSGCKMITYVPHPGVSIASKIIACLSDIVLKIFSKSSAAKNVDMDEFQLRLCLQKDMDATSDIYMYGIQCDFQFQETCRLIEEFHSKIQDGTFEEFEETFEAGFLKKVKQLNPKQPEIFYKRLGRLYKTLNDNRSSEEGAAFCIAFEDWPDALTTISRLHRSFKVETWNASSVMKAWEGIYTLLQDERSVVGDVLKKVQDCICVLIQERSVMEKYVMDLQKQN